MRILPVPQTMGYFAKQRAEYLRDMEPQQYTLKDNTQCGKEFIHE